MPHKRANRSVREQRRSQQEHDIAPGKESIGDEAVPKSIARVLGAAKVRGEWRAAKRRNNHEVRPAGESSKRRKLGGGDGEQERIAKTVPLTIQPGETLRHFNRRVETDMRPVVHSTIKSSTRVDNRLRKQDSRKLPPEATPLPRRAETSSVPSAKSDGLKEFPTTSSALPRRLNEVVAAPPTIKRIPRGAISSVGKRDGVISMAQKASMDAEREKAILRYREMKEKARTQLQMIEGAKEC